MKKFLFLLSALSSPAIADEAATKQDFVDANVISIFYHEFGHAAIDLLQLPIYGQEEDAADNFSTFMIDALFENQAATAVASDAAQGFWLEALTGNMDYEQVAWWDVHGPSLQRYYNHVCLFYGADPDARKEFANNAELPEERAEGCPMEYDSANFAWGTVLDDLAEAGKYDGKLVLHSDGSQEAQFIMTVLEPEIQILNENFSVPRELVVKVESCDEANAFYDSEDKSITFCTEFVPHLFELAE